MIVNSGGHNGEDVAAAPKARVQKDCQQEDRDWKHVVCSLQRNEGEMNGEICILTFFPLNSNSIPQLCKSAFPSLPYYLDYSGRILRFLLFFLIKIFFGFVGSPLLFSLVVVSKVTLQLWCLGFSLWWLLPLWNWSTGSRAQWLQQLLCMGSVVAAH